MESLGIVCPIFNEEEIIENVLLNLTQVFEELGIDYTIFAYNDGSTDNSENIISNLCKQNQKIILHTHQNRGHGQTVLKGYKETVKHFDWIFQIDADNEMDPTNFKFLWEKRNEYDYLTGIRTGRTQSLSRFIISAFSRFFVKLLWGKGPLDVNCPFRLMKSSKFIDLFNQLPENIYSPNLMISGFVAKKQLKYYEINIPCAQRTTGTVSLQKFKLLKTAFISFWQNIYYSFIVK